jgi:hypothetical protein
VPGQIQRAFRDFVGTIVAFVQRDGFDNALGEALLVLEPREINTVEKEISLIGLNLLHGHRIAQGLSKVARTSRGSLKFCKFYVPREAIFLDAGCDCARGSDMAMVEL